MIVDNTEKAKRLLEQREQIPNLKHIIIIDNNLISEISEEYLHGIQLHQFENLLEIEDSNVVVDLQPTPDDIYIIR